jgi:hypothetical protein
MKQRPRKIFFDLTGSLDVGDSNGGRLVGKSKDGLRQEGKDFVRMAAQEGLRQE